MSKSKQDLSAQTSKKDKSQKKKKTPLAEEQHEDTNLKVTQPKPKKTREVVEHNDIDDADDDFDLNDDIYIPKKKNKKSNETGKATKVTKASEELKPSNKRKGKSDEPQPESSDDGNDDEGFDDEVDETNDEPKVSKKQMKKKLKAERFNNASDEKAEASQRGIIYVGHLPYGFVEEGLKEYFSQYGEILNINVARSKKTARPKGYAFIEFKHKDVAQIAADSMNGYMIFGKVMQCKLIKDDEGMNVKTKKFRFIPHQKRFIEEKNKDKDSKEVKKEVKSLLKHEEKKREKLRELGIEYEFPGFKSLVNGSNE